MSEENLAVVQRGWDAWMSGDMTALYALLDPDIVWDTSNFEDWPEAAYHGVDGVSRFLEEWDDYVMEIQEILVAPDGRVVTLIHQTGHGHQSGLPMDMPMAQIATVRDGSIVRIDNYGDQAKARGATGIAD